MLKELKKLLLITAVFAVSACGGGSDSGTDNTITTPVNRAPIISGTPLEATVSQSFLFQPQASDPDNDTLTFSIVNKPSWLVFDATNGTLAGTPANADAAVYNDIVISVSDGYLTSSLTISITVQPEPNQTINLSVNLSSAVVTATYYHQLVLSLSDNGLTYTVNNLPDWANFDSNSLAISGIPDQIGTQPVIITATDGEDTWRLEGAINVMSAEKYQVSNLIDFYSKNYDGETRQLRNDLTGELAAEVQFVQSHSVAPNNNYNRNTTDETASRYMPKLVAQRDALLLFLPHANDDIETASASFFINGELAYTLQLKHPNTLPAADLDNGGSVAYSAKAWWGHIPWQYVKNGLEIDFQANDKVGKLPASVIDIGEASQLVLKSIRLGMLTTPDQSQGHYTLREPVLAATDYFQTIPTSQLVIASYADMVLDKVIIANGTIYDKEIDGSSSVEGGVYGGDMRENVAKAQVSTGINMADYGYTSNNMYQSYPHVFKQITNHHAWGQYINGRIAHGLSGGNGIGTLISSWGNEASHEWGHAYGLGHYPGQGLTTDGRWAVHHADSGWGFIAHRNRMRSNIVSVNGDGSYLFHRDAMSGGSSNSQFSTYTHHTGYSARVIQDNIAAFPIADPSFESGYKKWNTQTGQYETYRDTNNRPKPEKAGVAVATILGGYDPINYSAVIYPVFHGNYGNVFDLPAPNLADSSDQCWVEIKNAQNEQKLIAIAAARHNPSSINQLHFNIEAEFKPTLAVLNCQHNETITELSRTSFDGEIPVLPEVAIVGQQHGFNQLKTREFVEIDNELSALDDGVILLPEGLAAKVDSYDFAELSMALSDDNRDKLTQMLNYRSATASTITLLRHAEAEGLTESETARRLQLHLLQTGLLETDTIDVTGAEIHGNGYFFDGSNSEGGVVFLSQRTDDNIDNRTLWFRDAYGRLHPSSEPWLCMTQSGNNTTLQRCVATDLSQRWRYLNDNPLILQNVSSGRCFDFDRINLKVIPYGCHGGWNQQWRGVLDLTPLWLAVLNGDEIQKILQLLAPE